MRRAGSDLSVEQPFATLSVKDDRQAAQNVLGVRAAGVALIISLDAVAASSEHVALQPVVEAIAQVLGGQLLDQRRQLARQHPDLDPDGTEESLQALINAGADDPVLLKLLQSD